MTKYLNGIVSSNFLQAMALHHQPRNVEWGVEILARSDVEKTQENYVN